MQDINLVVVYLNDDMVRRFFRTNPNVQDCRLVAVDNRPTNRGLPEIYNEIIAQPREEDCWFFFVHEDFQITSPLADIRRLNPQCVYGTFGVKIENGIPIGYGRHTCSNKDGSAPMEVGLPIQEPTEVDTLDCQSILVHSSLLNAHPGLRFDENLSFDLYTEDFCISARINFGLRVCVFPLKVQHHSFGKITERYYIGLEHLARKYPDVAVAGSCSFIGGRAVEAEKQFSYEIVADQARSAPHIAILLCTCNGEEYLEAQLDSIARQTAANWQLWVSDDGSRDGTLAILAQYQKAWGDDKMVVLRGPGRGPATNFLSLVHNRNISADYFAYCDQDDIWHPEKLERATRLLQAQISGPNSRLRPLLYGSRTCYVDRHDQEIGLSPLFRREPVFANALVQNIAGGNTMVFNSAARRLLWKCPPQQPVVMHDWWTYISVSACGGRVFYDTWPSVRYRQHDHNQIGHNTGLRAKISRLRMAMKGRLREWNTLHLAALSHLEPCLSKDSRHRLKQFEGVRQKGPLRRIRALRRSGVFRQGLPGHLALYLLALLGRL
ncbi:MAG: glycosyltransferase family 2 protein [Castellaniella sp.]